MNSIFISSTFKDMQAERDLLHQYVMPLINEALALKRKSFSSIDLRWGVFTDGLSEDEAERKSLATCFDEIDDSRPYFICFLGERYGFQCDLDKFKQIIKYCKNGSAVTKKADILSEKVSITELEIFYATILSQNIDRCLFYIRKPFETEEEHDLFHSESEEEKNKQKALIAYVEKNFPKQCHYYQTNYDKKTKQISFEKNFAQKIANDFISILSFEEEIECSDDEKLKKYVDFVIKEKADTFFSRTSKIKDLADFLHNDKKVLHLKGESGNGKTSLICKMLTDYASEFTFIPILCGSTKELSTQLGVFKYLYYQISRCYGFETVFPIENHFSKSERYGLCQMYVDQIKLSLSTMNREAQNYPRIVIVFDAINQLDSYSWISSLSFLPIAFCYDNEIAKTIITSTPEVRLDSFSEQLYDVEKKTLEGINEQEIGEIAQGILKRRHHRELSAKIIDSIKKKRNACNCLYLSLLLQRLIIVDRYEFDEIYRQESEMEVIVDAREKYLLDVLENIEDDIDKATIQILLDVQTKLNCNVNKAMQMISISENGLNMGNLSSLLKNDFNESQFLFFKRYLSMLIGEKNNGEYFFLHEAVKNAILKSIDEKTIFTYQTNLIAYYNKNNNEKIYDLEMFNLLYSLKCYMDIYGVLVEKIDEQVLTVSLNDAFVERTLQILSSELNELKENGLLNYLCQVKSKKVHLFVSEFIISAKTRFITREEIPNVESFFDGIISLLTHEEEAFDLYFFASAFLGYIYQLANTNDIREYDSPFLKRLTIIIKKYFGICLNNNFNYYGVSAFLSIIKNYPYDHNTNGKLLNLLEKVADAKNYESAKCRSEIYVLQYEIPHYVSDNRYICENLHNSVGELIHYANMGKDTYEQKKERSNLIAKLAILFMETNDSLALKMFDSYYEEYTSVVTNICSIETWQAYGDFLNAYSFLLDNAYLRSDEDAQRHYDNTYSILLMAKPICQTLFKHQNNQHNAKLLVDISARLLEYEIKRSMCNERSKMEEDTKNILAVATRCKELNMDEIKGVCAYLKGFYCTEQHLYDEAILHHSEALELFSQAKTFDCDVSYFFKISNDLQCCYGMTGQNEKIYDCYINYLMTCQSVVSKRVFVSLAVLKTQAFLISYGIRNNLEEYEIKNEFDLLKIETLYEIMKAVYEVDMVMSSAKSMILLTMPLINYYELHQNATKLNKINEAIQKDDETFMLYFAQYSDEQDALLGNARTLYERGMIEAEAMKKRVYMQQVDRIACVFEEMNDYENAFICFYLALKLQEEVVNMQPYNNNAHYDYSICYKCVYKMMVKLGDSNAEYEWLNMLICDARAFELDIFPFSKIGDGKRILRELANIKAHILFDKELEDYVGRIIYIAMAVLDYLPFHREENDFEHEHAYIEIAYIQMLFLIYYGYLQQAYEAFLHIRCAIDNLSAEGIALSAKENNIYLHAVEYFLQMGGTIDTGNAQTIEEQIALLKEQGFYTDDILTLPRVNSFN